MTATRTRAQLTPEEKARQRLVLRLAELGIPTTDTDRQRHVCAVWTRGEARRRSEMTEAQADSLTRRLRQRDAADALAHALALPLPGPDLQPEAPAATVTEPGPADTGDALRPGTRDGDDRATVADHRPAVPAPLAVEPPCRTPEEIEAAAEAAVARFRERQAAGIVPEPPALGSIPPRVPQLVGPAPGRYCLRFCWCGSCEQYPEQREAAERAYRQELTAARNRDLRG